MLKRIIIKKNSYGNMKIYYNANLANKHQKGIIAIGNFDGIHLGHQKVLKEARVGKELWKIFLYLAIILIIIEMVISNQFFRRT